MERVRKGLRIFSYVIAGLALVGITICCFHSDKLDISNYNFKNERLNGDSFKATVISDYHHRELKFKNTNLIDAINNLEKQDAIFITGDLIDTHNKNIDDQKKIFEASCNKATKVYFVTGNHEEYAPLFNELKDSFKNYSNFEYLDNKSDLVTFADKNVCIYGLEDPRFYSHSYKNGKKDYGNSEKYLEQFKPTIKEDKINILLAHRPELVDLYSKYNFDYVISGHTHGGQFRIGNLTGWSILHSSDNYSRGQFKITDRTNLIVSAGLGYTAMFPLRINCNPELVTINITK